MEDKEVAKIEEITDEEAQKLLEEKKEEKELSEEEKNQADEDAFFKDLDLRVQQDEQSLQKSSSNSYMPYVWIGMITLFIVFVIIILTMLFRRT